MSFTCDHSLISFNVDLYESIDLPNSTYQYPDFRRANFSIINENLNSINWSDILESNTSLQTKYNKFIFALNSVIKKHVPLKSKNNKPPKRPKHLVRLLKNKLHLYRKLKKDKSFKSAYKEAIRKYDSAVRDWYDNIESNMTKNPNSKKFYSYVNKKLKNKSSIPPLLDADNNLVSSNHDKANLLNLNFQNSFTIDNQILPPIPIRATDPMQSFYITSTDVLTAISKNQRQVDCTPEDIPPYFIKQILKSI